MEALNLPLADLQTHWLPIAPIFALRNEVDYDAAVIRMNALIDEVGTNANHPLYGLLDTLGTLVHSYETEQQAVPDVTGPEVLEFLMEEHRLTSTDLPELGSVEEVQLYLDGSKTLSIQQVRSLARRFRVSPAAFI
jgi:HTH-type transcriptional regulator/antitoxin HigA